MKRLSALFVAGALTAAMAVPLNGQSSDISGEWELTRGGGPGGGGGGQRGGRRGGGGPTKMVIEQDGNSFTGTLELPFGEAKIQEGKIDGNEITFVVQIETPRANFEMQYTGKVDGDSMAGTWTGGRGGGCRVRASARQLRTGGCPSARYLRGGGSRAPPAARPKTRFAPGIANT